MKTNLIPETDSIEELARFWDEHELTDFDSDLEEVPEPVFGHRNNEAVVQVQLSWQEMERLQSLASQRGVAYTELIQEWVQEKLQAA